MRFFATTLLQLTLTASAVLASPASSKQRSPVTTIPVKRADLSGYEYVVVGSGAGGGPVAARLATNGHKVLLIDAGDDQGANINEQVPAFHGLSTEDATMRWDYYVNHYQDPARQAKDTKAVYQTSGGGQYVGLNPPAGAKLLGILYPRAGTLGGCGSHNALITVTPHDSDWNNIQSITGDSSWSASNMKQYFVRLEHVNYTPNSGVGHGTTGWFWTERADVQLALHDSKVVSQLIAAAAAMGQGLLTTLLSSLTNLANVLLTDMNSGLPGRDSREGLFQIPLARRDKARNGPRQFVVDTANAVNADGSKKYQLDIRLNCLVTKIIWDKSGSKPKAIGVEFLDGQSLYRADPRSGSASAGTPGSVNVTREVIISAGAFNTPQLLKLSGVGPQAELQKFNIPVVVNLPGVGTNLQDRYEIGVNSKVPTDFTILDGCTFNQGNDQCLQQWKSGQLSAYESTGFAQAILRRSSQAIGTDVDTFLFAGPHNFRGYYPNYEGDAVADHRHWTWAILKGHTGNTAGTVALRSADPKDTPIINFNYFDTGTASAADRDLNAIVEAVALARKINSNLPLLSETFTEVSPANNTNNLANLQEFVKNNAWGHHASCTCPIGADGDPNAVLNTNFQVRGTTGLRVVDASAFPRIPGLFLAVPLYMLAEKAADVIHAAASS